jgi:hypothetical protein
MGRIDARRDEAGPREGLRHAVSGLALAVAVLVLSCSKTAAFQCAHPIAEACSPPYGLTPCIDTLQSAVDSACRRSDGLIHGTVACESYTVLELIGSSGYYYFFDTAGGQLVAVMGTGGENPTSCVFGPAQFNVPDGCDYLSYSDYVSCCQLDITYCAQDAGADAALVE